MQKIIMKLRNFVREHFNVRLLKKIPGVQLMNNALMNKTMKQRAKNLNLHGYEVLQTCFNAIIKMEESNRPCVWLDYGTLLGFVREGCLIEHDYDLDLGCMALDVEKRKRLIKELEKNGMSHVRSFSFGEIPVVDAFLMNDIILDIDYYYDCDDPEKLVSYTFDDNEHTEYFVSGGKRIIKGENVYRIISDRFEVCSGMFQNGLSVMIPDDPEKIVIAEYGPNWRIPDKNWDWKTGMKYEELGFKAEFHGEVEA